MLSTVEREIQSETIEGGFRFYVSLINNIYTVAAFVTLVVSKGRFLWDERTKLYAKLRYIFLITKPRVYSQVKY